MQGLEYDFKDVSLAAGRIQACRLLGSVQRYGISASQNILDQILNIILSCVMYIHYGALTCNSVCRS